MDSYRRFLDSKYFPSLDGLRGLSIIAVVWHHASGHRAGLLGKGFLGVDLFFAISGLLITTLLLREADRTGTISLRGFYLRRTLRIFPLYYAVIALYVAVVFTLERNTAAGRAFFENLPTFLTYTSNWFVELGPRVIFYFAWSLATEEQFYLLWPSIVRYARGWAPAVMAAMLLGGVGARLGVSQGLLSPDPLWVRVVGSIAAPICFGCLGAYVLHARAGFERAWRFAGQRWSAPVAAILALAAAAFEATPSVVVSLAMALLVVACAIRPDHGLRGLLELKPLAYVGTISYGMYLLHMLALNVARRLAPASAAWVQFLLGLGIVIASATLTYRHFEVHFLRLKDRMRRPAPAGAPAPRATAEPAA